MISIHEKNMHLITTVSSVSIVWPKEKYYYSL